jgi:hypothetical protein
MNQASTPGGRVASAGRPGTRSQSFYGIEPGVGRAVSRNCRSVRRRRIPERNSGRRQPGQASGRAGAKKGRGGRPKEVGAPASGMMSRLRPSDAPGRRPTCLVLEVRAQPPQPLLLWGNFQLNQVVTDQFSEDFEEAPSSLLGGRIVDGTLDAGGGHAAVGIRRTPAKSRRRGARLAYDDARRGGGRRTADSRLPGRSAGDHGAAVDR